MRSPEGPAPTSVLSPALQMGTELNLLSYRWLLVVSGEYTGYPIDLSLFPDETIFWPSNTCSYNLLSVDSHLQEEYTVVSGWTQTRSVPMNWPWRLRSERPLTGKNISKL